MVNVEEHIKNRHLKRRMFAIVHDKLMIAEPNIPDSHIQWFEKEGCVWFYCGKECLIDENSEKIFFKHLPEIVERLNISKLSIIKGGKIRGDVLSGDWPARKEYGSVGDWLVN